MHPFVVNRVPIVECQGELEAVNLMDIEFLADLVDIPTHIPPKVLVGRGPDSHNHNRFYVGVLHPDGMVDCIHFTGQRSQWVWYGRWFGYPSCCIDAFRDVRRRSVDSVFDGSGFVPCKKCDETKTQHQLLEEISNRRIAEEPFMLDGSSGYGKNVEGRLKFLKEVLSRYEKEGLECV